MIPPSLCFHFLALAANVAFLRILGSGLALPLAMHSEVTLPPQYLVNEPFYDSFM